MHVLIPVLAVLAAAAPAATPPAPADTAIRHRPVPVGRTELAAAPVEVPLDLGGDRPVIEARINGKGPYRFILDTGAGSTVLEQSLADELGLKKLGEARAGDPSSNRPIAASFSSLDSVTLGGATFHEVPCVYWARSTPLPGSGPPRGIIGFPMFRDLLVTLDLPRQRLVLARGELPEPDGDRVLAFEVPRGIPVFTLALAGRPLRLHLDTGSGGSLTLPDPLADSLPLLAPPVEVGRARTVNSDLRVRAAQLDGDFHLGGRTYPRPELSFNALPIGTLGMQILRGFAITFDQRNRRARFLADTSVAAPPQRTRRYGIIPAAGDSGALTIERVIPGSPAERGGLRAGDVVLEIDGVPTATMSFSDRLAALRRPSIRIKVRRGAGEREYSLAAE